MATKVKTPQQKQLSTTSLILVMVLICVVVLGIGAYISYQVVGKLISGQKLASKQGQAASILSSNLQTAPVLVQNYQNLSPAVRQEITDALPTTPNVTGLIATLEHIAGVSGVQLQAFSPLAATSATGASTTMTSLTGALPVTGSLTVSGSYANIVQFISNMQLSARPMQLSVLQLQGSSSAMTLTVSLTTYYQPAASLQLKTGVIK